MTFEDHFENVELSPFKWATHIDKLTSLANDKDVFPVTVELDLVSFCNHSCWWCVDPLHKKISIDPTFVSRLLSELKTLGIEGIVFKGGGEPTLYKPFTKVIEEAKAHTFEIGIITNGSRLNNLYKEIVQNVNYIRVSIDGPTRETHQEIHQSHDYDNVIAGVQNLVEYRNELGQRHPIIGLSFAMDYSLFHHVGDAINLGEQLNVNYILLRPPFFEEVGRKNTMTIEQKKELLSRFESESKSYSGNMKIFIDYWISDTEASSFSSRDESPRRGKFLGCGSNGIEHMTGRCLASPLLAVVTADKQVYPCCNLRFLEDWSIGTIDYEKNITFRKLWESDLRKNVMTKIHNVKCIQYCTHPLSRYNEVIEYLRSPQYHKGFV